jgi:hypothetical protein
VVSKNREDGIGKRKTIRAAREEIPHLRIGVWGFLIVVVGRSS